jgi:hypothetical protein
MTHVHDHTVALMRQRGSGISFPNGLTVAAKSSAAVTICDADVTGITRAGE